MYLEEMGNEPTSPRYSVHLHREVPENVHLNQRLMEAHQQQEHLRRVFEELPLLREEAARVDPVMSARSCICGKRSQSCPYHRCFVPAHQASTTEQWVLAA